MNFEELKNTEFQEKLRSVNTPEDLLLVYHEKGLGIRSMSRDTPFRRRR